MNGKITYAEKKTLYIHSKKLRQKTNFFQKKTLIFHSLKTQKLKSNNQKIKTQKMPKSFTEEEVQVVLSILVHSLESLVATKETRDLLVQAGSSEGRIEDIINQKQIEEFVKAGFARERFSMICMIFRDYSDNEAIRTKLQKMCAIEEMFVNLVIGHNQKGHPLDNIFNEEIHIQKGDFAQQGVAPGSQSQGSSSQAPQALEMK